MSAMNFVQQALNVGFLSSEKDLKPQNNWFGLSMQHPDLILEKGAKKIIMSLNGMLSPIPDNITAEWETLARSMAIKYIAFKCNEKVLYETHHGELPTQKFIDDFISSL